MQVDQEEGGPDSSGRGKGNGEIGQVKKERRKSRASLLSMSSSTPSGGGGDMDGSVHIPLPQQPKEVQVKGVRVCRECWATVS